MSTRLKAIAPLTLSIGILAFLASEVERYRPQLDRYAAALATIDSRPVQVGLYFPLLATLRAWPANA